MRTPAYLCLLLTCMLISCTPTQEKHEIDYTSYVNPFIGTDFTGNTYPGAQAPFGMVQLSPDNGLPGWDRISGYFYPDSTIAGFSHTHLSGTGAGDLYDISFMPVTLPYKEAEAPLGIHSKFSHKDESAHAGYYQVRLTDYNINVELTATERCGIQRYTFPEAQSAIFLNLKKAMNWDFTNDSHIEVVDSVTIQGYRFSDGWARDQHIYFRTRFSKPFEKMELDTTAIIKDNKRIGTAVIARFDFNTRFCVLNCITNMKEKKMSNLSEEIINRYLTGQCSEEELIEVNAWMKESEENARQLFRMEEIYHLGKFDQYTDEQRILRAEKQLYKKLDEEKGKQSKILSMHRWMKYAAVIAAMLVMGGGIGYWFYQSGNNQQMMVAVASEGIVKEVVLPDGSKVWLNNAATLKYPREFSEKERNVYLEGEAYFEVTKNRHKPFTVQSDAIRVRVLGTTFNLKSDKRCRIAEATLIEGEIEVKGNKEEGQIILTPGQRAELNKNNGRLTVKQVDAKLDAVWHDNLIPFQKADIFTITKALERFYDVKIILSPDIQTGKTYSGVLKRKSNIESVLKSLQNSIPIDYKIVGNNIFISPK